MNEQGEDREQVFVVRFWPDRSSAEAKSWRGCVDRVLTGDRQFFVDLSALTEFLNACLDQASNARSL